jgi:two-component system torCAD operon response regulator TorR
MKPKILAVDDMPDVLALLDTSLTEEGYDVITCTTAAEFRRIDATEQIGLYLIDVTLQDGNGFSLVKELRKTTDKGIILLTGRTSETDHVVGLEIGADDYVTKPFRIRELAARVNAVYRRTSARDSRPEQAPRPEGTAMAPSLVDYTFDGYRLSAGGRRLWDPEGQEIEMTTAEFELLLALLRHRGQVLSRDQLMNAIKGREWESYDRAIDGLVSRVRRKIPPPGNAGPYIRTIHGIGYSFTA